MLQRKKQREALKQQILNEHNKMFQFFGGLKFNHLVFLLVLGAVTALTAYAVDVTVFQINSSMNTRTLTNINH